MGEDNDSPVPSGDLESTETQLPGMIVLAGPPFEGRNSVFRGQCADEYAIPSFAEKRGTMRQDDEAGRGSRSGHGPRDEIASGKGLMIDGR